MKNVCTLFLLATLLVSCHKDDFAPPTQVNTEIESPRTQLKESSTAIVTATDIPHITKHLRSHIASIGFRNSSAVLSVDSIVFDEIFEIQSTDSIVDNIYTFYVKTALDTNYFNVIIEELEDGWVKDPFVILYDMDSTYSADFHNGRAPVDSFSGYVSKYEFETLFGIPTSTTRDPLSLEF